MCFPVNAAHTSICINDSPGIEHLSVIPGFIKAHRNHRFQLFLPVFFHMDDSIIFLWRSCISIIFISSLLTEILSFESSGGRMTCAPCAAASLISSDAFSIFSFTSLPQPICMAATVVFLISCSSHPPGISRYLLCNTMNVPTTDNNITCVNRVYFPSWEKAPHDVHSLCIHFILKLGESGLLHS